MLFTARALWERAKHFSERAAAFGAVRVELEGMFPEVIGTQVNGVRGRCPAVS